MRKRKIENGLTVNPIAGTRVITLGVDVAKEQRKGRLGFALQHTDHTEKYWIQGGKTFEEDHLFPGRMDRSPVISVLSSGVARTSS